MDQTAAAYEQVIERSVNMAVSPSRALQSGTGDAGIVLQHYCDIIHQWKGGGCED